MKRWLFKSAVYMNQITAENANLNINVATSWNQTELLN